MLKGDSILPYFSFQDLEVIVRKLKRTGDIDNDRTLKLYPGIIKNLIQKMELTSEESVNNLLDMLIVADIEDLKAYSRTDNVEESPEFKKTLLVLKRLRDIS